MTRFSNDDPAATAWCTACGADLPGTHPDHDADNPDAGLPLMRRRK
jgi:hypothetical protein